MDSRQRDKDKLRDILWAIGEAMNYHRQRKQDIDKMADHAAAYMVAIVGEAASYISKELQEKNPQVPWKEVIGMRHRIVHGYGSLDISILRQVLNQDIHILEEQITAILKDLKS